MKGGGYNLILARDHHDSEATPQSMSEGYYLCSNSYTLFYPIFPRDDHHNVANAAQTMPMMATRLTWRIPAPLALAVELADGAVEDDAEADELALLFS